MVVKEWHCGACGLDFDSQIEICPRCGATEPYVVRAFRTPPGFKSDQTKITDTSLQNFTQHYGLSDFSNNPSTAHEKKYMGADGTPISLNDTWMPAGNVVSAPEPGESRADVLKAMMPAAALPVKKPTIINPRSKADLAGVE